MIKNKQNSTIILPLVYPPITSFPVFANTLSILCNYKKTEAWIYNNFINLWCEDYNIEDKGIPIRFSSWQIKDICPFLHYSRLQMDVVSELFKNYKDFIVSLISLGYYVFLTYDMFYLPCYEGFQKTHEIHHLFVFGFDKESETFDIADFFKGKYSFEKALFSEVEEAVSNAINLGESPHDYFIDIMKFKDIDYKFDIDLMIKSIEDYLYSTNTVLSYEEKVLDDYEKRAFYNKKMVLGISNYDLINKYLSYLLINKELNKDIRPFHILYDHKVIMLLRLNYMKDNCIIKDNNSLYERFLKIKDKCLINRNLFIKYSMTLDNDIIKRITENLNNILSEEKAAMLDLLDELNIKR